MSRVPIVIAISGKARIGKTTLANFLLPIFQANTKLKVEIIPLAKKIKSQAIMLGWNGEKDEAGRKLLQDLTKPIKTYHGQDYYAKSVYSEICENSVDICIIDDFRFKAEAHYFENLEKDGKLIFLPIRIENKHFVSPLSEDAQKDISEVDLDDYKPWIKVNNEGSLEEFKRVARVLYEFVADECLSS